MSTFTPIDQDVRELAATDLDASMTLSAGAGTGKTTTLVTRVLNLLRSGVEPDRIAVVTFTTKATRELQERVYDGLERARRAAGPGERERIEELQTSLNELHVSTIHAFCRMLLRWEALQAKWSPNVELVDEAIAGDAVGEAYNAWREQFNAAYPEFARILRKTANEGNVRKAALAIVENRDLEPSVGLTEARWGDAHRELIDEIRSIDGAFEACTDMGDTLAKNNLDTIGELRRLVGREPEQAVRSARELKFSLSGGSKNNWPGDSKDAFKDAVKAFRERRKPWRYLEFEPVHTALVRHAKEHFLPMVQKLKAERGQADFQDLLFGAKNLLKNSVTARRRLHNRFDAVLVDEVQDTDPIQSELITLLTRAPGDEGPWNAEPPVPGKLFAVGDPKQSIYRFRRADVAQWRALSELVSRDGHARALRQNFRSVPGITRWVNHTFANMPGYEPIEAAREPAAIDPVVSVVHDGEREDAELLAVYLRKLVDQGARVEDPETRELRRVTWGDCMVLVPGWTNAEKLRDTLLRAQVPATVEGGKQFFKRDEIRLCIAALRALAEPGDSEAVVFVLRGLFGLSIDELAEHKRRDGAWRYTIPEQPHGPARDALDVLKELHAKRGLQSWVVTLDQLLAETQSRAVWSMTARASAIQANLVKLRTYIRQCEEAAKSPAEAVKLLQSVAKYGDDKDVSVVDDDSNEVSIMTHFGAKGLESPVVLMPYATRKPDYNPVVVVDREAGTMGVNAGSQFRSPNWDRWKQMDLAEQEEERARWMYVAATRARDQFVFFYDESGSDSASLITPYLNRGREGEIGPDGRVEVADGVHLRVLHGESLGEVEFQTETFPGLDEQIDEHLAAGLEPAEDPVADWSQGRTDAIRSSRRRSNRWTSATALTRQGVRRKRKPERLDVAIGTAIHRVMEHLDLKADAEPMRQRAYALLATIAEEEELHGEFVDKAEGVLEQMLANPVFDRVRQAPEHWKEVPFAYEERGRIIAGIIDLVFPVNDGWTRWVVVDWKTDRPEEPEIQRAYMKQVEIYARALAKNITGIEPEDVEPLLVGPYEALEDVAEEEFFSGLEWVVEEAREPLKAAVESGMEPPEIGLEVGDSFYLNTFLAYPDKRWAVVTDQPDEEIELAREAGWTIVEVIRDDAQWVDQTIAALREANS